MKVFTKGAVVAAVIGLFGLVGTNWYSARLADQQEANRQKAQLREFELQLMIQALQSETRATKIENLRFLIEAGFIGRDNEKVLHLASDTAFHIHWPADNTPNAPPPQPVMLPAPSAPVVRNVAPTFQGTIVDDATEKPLAGVKISVRVGDMEESMVTSYNGRFRLHYPRSNYILEIERPGYRPYGKRYMGRGRMQDSLTFRLEKENGE